MSERQEQSRTSFPEHTRWWIDGPIFATDRRGGRITTLAPRGSTGTLSAGDALRALGVMLFWAVFLFFAPMNLTMPAPVPWVAETRTQWWWYAILILGIVLLLTVGAFGLHSGIIERFGQRSLAMLIVALPVSVGALIAMSLHLLLFRAALDAWPTDGFDPDKPDPTVPLLFTYAAAAAVVFFAVAVPLRLRGARLTQRRIASLREEGRRRPGVLEEVRFTNARDDDLSLFEVTIRVDDPAEPLKIRAHMATIPSRVPLAGEPVVVFSAEKKSTRGTRAVHLIEPDTTRPLRFDPDSTKYVVAADGGGSG